jgi:uncharacterized membrane protein
MESGSIPRHKIRFTWVLMSALAVVVTITAVMPYLSFRPELFNNATIRFREAPLWKLWALYGHIFGGSIALIVGAFQFMPGMRVRAPLIHRWAGRVYLILGVGVGGVSALIAAPGARSGLGGVIAFSLLAVLWLWTGAMAYRAVKLRDFEAHREWMTRNYALTFAAVTLRLWLGLLILAQLPFLQSGFGGDFDALYLQAYRVVMWLSWVPNLLFAEFFLLRKRMRIGLREKPEPL